MGCNNSKTKGAKKGKTGEETAPQQQGSVNGAEAARDATASQLGDIPGTPVPPPVAAESTTTYGTPADGASERRGGSAEAAAAAQPAVETASAGKQEADAAGPEEAHVVNEEEGEGGQPHNADGATSTASSADEGSESDAAGAHGGSDAAEAQLQSPDPMSSTARGVQQAGAAAPVPASDAAGHTTDEFTPVATDEVTGVPASFSTRHEMSSPPPQEPLTTAAAPGTAPAEETSQGSDVHFEVLDTDEDAAVTEHEEWPAVGEEEEEEPQKPQPLQGSTGAPRAPPPPNLTDAEALTPMAMETAPVPTPVRSAAGGGKARGSAAPSSNTSFHGPKQQPAGAGPRRPTSRKPSVAGSSVSAGAYASSRRPSCRPTKKQEQRLHQRPPWQSIVSELDEDEDYEYGHSPAARPRLPGAAAAPTTNTRPPPPGSQRSATSEEYYRVMAPAHPATAAAAPPSLSTSSTELVVHEAELPASTPTERIAARRWRAGMGQTAVADPPAMELAVHPRSSRGASTNTSHPRQRRASRQVAVLPPIPYRQGYTDPSPGAAPHAHRPATTYMPPPTAFAMRSSADGSASARPVLDPKVFVAAIEASTTGLIQAHNPRVTAPTAAAAPAPHAHHDGSMAPSLSASLASRLPVAGADATVYREPVKLAPSHLCDPVYSAEASVLAGSAAAAPAGNGSVSASASTYSRSSQQARPQTVSVPAQPQPPQPQRQAVYASPSQQSQRSAPASRAAAPASTAASSYKAPTASDTRPRAAVRQRAPAPSAGYGDDVDAVSVDASSYRSAQEVGSGYEQVYSSAQEPRERSAVTYEPSVTDEAPPTSASMLQANAASRNGVAATNVAARAKENAARDEDSYDGYAEDEQQQQQHQREPSWSAAEGEDEYDAYDDDGKVQAPSAEPEEAAASANGDAENEPATATATALTAMPSSDGHVVEHKDPEWQLLQPPPAENRRLLNQAKFVAQMRNVTPI